MRLHEADPDVVAYQEIRLKGNYNVVCAQMYDKEGREYQREWAQGVPLLVRSMNRWSSSTAMSHIGGGSRSMWRS